MKPVTVIFPFYKRPVGTLMMLDCLNDQTLSDFELFLMGDACPDYEKFINDEEVQQLLVSLRNKGTVVHTFNAPKHIGSPFDLINHAIKNADSEYIMFVANDDLILPMHLESYYSNVKATEADLGYVNVKLNNLNKRGLLITKLAKQELIDALATCPIRSAKLAGGCIGHSEIIVKTDVAKAARPHKAGRGHDWVFIKDIMDKGYKCQKLNIPPTYIVGWLRFDTDDYRWR